jgi:PAS domain S-box-containing protein
MSELLNVMVIDDDEDDFIIVKNLLQKIDGEKIYCTWAKSLEEARLSFNRSEHNLYLVDYSLGNKTGIDFLNSTQTQNLRKPVIMFTGKDSREADEAALKAGAYDYLVKSGLTSEKLEKSIRYALERYKAYVKLSDSELRYRQIFENTLSFIFICDESLLFTECNPAVAFFLGHDAEDLFGTSLLEIIHPNDRQKFIESFKYDTHVYQSRIRFISGTGQSKTGMLTLKSFDNSTASRFWQGIIHDETLSQQAEQHRLLTEKLATTERLIRTLAHEMRTPLTNIGLATEELLKTVVTTSEEYTQIIRRATTKLNNILNEILNSARVKDLNKAPVDLNILVLEVIEQVKDRLDLGRMKSVLELYPLPVIRELDKSQVKIAIQNIVINCIEAIHHEHGEIRMTISEKDGIARLLISDNGTGMNTETLQRLFEPYFTTKKTGLGLGLVASLSIIQAHRFTIDVESSVGKGTTFTIYFN